MTHQVVVPLAPGFEEIEAVTVIDVLRRADVEVLVAGTEPGVIEGSHGISVKTDITIDDVDASQVTMVVLPGGLPGATNLRDHGGVQDLLSKVNEQEGWLAAICAAPMALGPSGVTKDKCCTSYPGFSDKFEQREYVESRVVVDGRVVTSRGVGTALEFSLELVRLLVGNEKADALEAGMLVSRPESTYRV